MTEFVPPQPSLDLTPDREPILAGEPARTRSAVLLAESRFWLHWLANPWVDKVLAILAITPFVYPIALHFRHQFRPAELVYLAQVLTLIGTVVFRRLPVRISINPYHWVVAFLASYWGLLILSIEQPGVRLTATWIPFFFYLSGAFVEIWGRLSLGRNIAMLPAQRRIVESGAYRWVRHPIYTAAYLLIVAQVLSVYSLRNLFLYSLGVVLFVVRSLGEEQFLRQDPQYAAYMNRVPWRWFPGLI